MSIFDDAAAAFGYDKDNPIEDFDLEEALFHSDSAKYRAESHIILEVQARIAKRESRGLAELVQLSLSLPDDVWIYLEQWFWEDELNQWDIEGGEVRQLVLKSWDVGHEYEYLPVTRQTEYGVFTSDPLVYGQGGDLVNRGTVGVVRVKDGSIVSPMRIHIEISTVKNRQTQIRTTMRSLWRAEDDAYSLATGWRKSLLTIVNKPQGRSMRFGLHQEGPQPARPVSRQVSIRKRNPSEKCFQCGKKLGKNPHLVDTRDAQIVAVGNECFKHIVAAGEKGWRHPKHKSGLKCWVIDENTTDEYGDPRNNPGVQHRIREDQGDGFRIDTDFGFIQYRPVDGDNEIWWIESKKKGGGTQLMDLMVEHHPCETVSWGATSQAGQSFREKWHNAHPDIQDATDGERIPFDSQFDPYEDDSQFDPYEDED